MIWGVGIDIVEVDRIRKNIESDRFLEKILTKNEIHYLKSRNLRVEYVAGRFAAKEAVVKALGTGFRGFSITDIEIVNEKEGKPIVILSNKAEETARTLGEYKIHLSISHEKSYAVAYAVMEVVSCDNRNS